MGFTSKITISLSMFIIIFENISPTIDMNTSELQYLADHLTPEECRTLIAGAHFESYEKPNVLDQAGRLTIFALLPHIY